MKVLITILISIFVTGCSTQSFKMFDNNTSVTQKSVSDEEYMQESGFEWKIAKGDRLDIYIANQGSVEGNDQMNVILNSATRNQYTTRDGSEGMLVPSNGVIRLPLIGNFKISGMTEAQASEALSDAFRKYLRNPYANVKILNQKLFVLGEVRHPGVVQVTHGTMTVFEALATAGDVTDDADRTNIKIVRGGTREPTVREINLASLDTIKLNSMLLQPNDIIYIQPRNMKAYNVAFKEQMPFFELLQSMLAPFVSYTSIKNGKAVDVFLFK